jgi:hypothetical protein
MSAFDIQGRDCVFQLKIGDEYLTVICAKSFSVNVTTEMKDTTTVGGLGTGWWKEKRPRKLEYSITFNGTVQAVAEDDKPTIKTMLQNQVWFLPMDYRITYRDQSDNVIVLLGRVYNANTVINANPANVLDGTVELQGTGPIEISDALPNPVNLRLIMVDDGTGNQVGKARLVLLDAEGATVFQTDDLPQSVGGYLEGPAFDITTQVESGEYYYTWYTYTETDANLFHLNDPPGVTTAFPSGFQNGTSHPATLHDFTVPREVSFSLGPSSPPPGCVNVEKGVTPPMPDGTIHQPYTYSFPITGTPPFVISNVTKPAGLNITVNVGDPFSSVTISGTPEVDGDDLIVSFDITNCASGTASFGDTIDIAPAVNQSTLLYNFTVTSPAVGVFTIYVNGNRILNITAPASGSFGINENDVVEIQLNSFSISNTKHLTVVSDVDGSLYNSSSTSIRIFSFTTLPNREYTVTGNVTP